MGYDCDSLSSLLARAQIHDNRCRWKRKWRVKFGGGEELKVAELWTQPIKYLFDHREQLECGRVLAFAMWIHKERKHEESHTPTRPENSVLIGFGELTKATVDEVAVAMCTKRERSTLTTATLHRTK